MGERWKKVRKGIAWTLLPMAAFESLKESYYSFGRIKQMLKTGKKVDPDVPRTAKEIEIEEIAEEGKQIILKLPAKERFEYLYKHMKWTEKELAEQKKALSNSHAIRFCLLLLLLIVSPALIIKYGPLLLIYVLCVGFYLMLMCVKSTVMLIQLEDRALWSFEEIRQQLGRKLWIRSLWFLA